MVLQAIPMGVAFPLFRIETIDVNSKIIKILQCIVRVAHLKQKLLNLKYTKEFISNHPLPSIPSQ